MSRNKLVKFEQISSYTNVFEFVAPNTSTLTVSNGNMVDMKGQWNAQFFENNLPITMELACGRGEYSLALASENRNRNFIGVDIKGARIWQGAKNSLDNQLNNVAFLRSKIEFIDCYFAPNEINEIWITFPDPFLNASKSNRRLTSQMFLNRYKKILVNGGIIHLKTDSKELYDFSVAVIRDNPDYEIVVSNDDIYGSGLATINPELLHKTYYEKKHIDLRKKITYLKFQLNQTTIS